MTVRSLVALAAVAAALVCAPTASAKGCSVGDSRSYNTTYVLEIRADGTSCRSARSVIRSFHACRPGKSGRCSRTKGYACRERRFDKISTQYSSRVTCRKGGRTVKHTYTQFT